jgi:NAD-dependent dihydropyrimidine dehydrogenase PreA subunit
MSRVSVISDRCIKDMRCITRCVRKAIHPAEGDPGYGDAKQLYINPKRCIGCGSCMIACQSGAIFSLEDLPEPLRHFAELNAAWYVSQQPYDPDKRL